MKQKNKIQFRKLISHMVAICAACNRQYFYDMTAMYKMGDGHYHMVATLLSSMRQYEDDITVLQKEIYNRGIVSAIEWRYEPRIAGHMFTMWPLYETGGGHGHETAI